MSRTPSAPLILLAAGAVSISVGLMRPWTAWGDGRRAAEAAGVAAPARERADRGPGPLSRLGGESHPEVEVRVLAVDVRAGGPARDAELVLWRRATGEGAAYRSSMRLSRSPVRTDDRGRAVLAAPPGVPLRIVARTADGGPPAVVDLAPLDPDGASTPVRVELDPAPEPLGVRVVGPEGAPVPGARVHLFPPETARWAALGASGTLARRTDGAGRCTLDGDVRSAAWIAVEAAGHAPRSVRVSDLEGALSHVFQLGTEARAEVRVRAEGSGEPVEEASVELRFELEGHATARPCESATDARGRARIRQLPSGVDLVPVVTLPGGAAQRFGPITLEPASSPLARQGQWPVVELVVDAR